MPIQWQSPRATLLVPARDLGTSRPPPRGRSRPWCHRTDGPSSMPSTAERPSRSIRFTPCKRMALRRRPSLAPSDVLRADDHVSPPLCFMLSLPAVMISAAPALLPPYFLPLSLVSPLPLLPLPFPFGAPTATTARWHAGTEAKPPSSAASWNRAYPCAPRGSRSFPDTERGESTLSCQIRWNTGAGRQGQARLQDCRWQEIGYGKRVQRDSRCKIDGPSCSSLSVCAIVVTLPLAV